MEDNVPMPNQMAANVVDQSQETNANGVPGSLPGETQAETKARLYKVKVDGEDIEVDEEELLRGYAHNKAASKRMQEASMTRKEAETVLKMFKENPREAFKILGTDYKKFAEDIINEEFQQALLSPEQKELQEYKRQVQEYRKEQEQAQLNSYAEKIQNDIVGSLETAGLPKTDRTVGRIVYYMQSALAAGYNVEPKDVIQFVKEDYISDFKSMIGGLSEDQIEMFLGNDVVRKIAKSTVQKTTTKTVPKEVNAGIERKPVIKKASPKDFFTKGF
jgi:hypothetical protein